MRSLRPALPVIHSIAQQEIPSSVIVTIQEMKRRVARVRVFMSFILVAVAQLLSPAAAADPASKIDPPAWSHRHSKEEMQAYGARATAQEPEKKNNRVISEARLRRILRSE